MAEYRITADEPREVPGADASPYTVFRVNGEPETVVRARVTRDAMKLGHFEGVDWGRVLALGALVEMEGRLRVGLLPTGEEGGLTIQYGSYDDDAILEIVSSLKDCRWQRQARAGGKVCVATPKGRPEPTTAPLCQRCAIPDSRLICSGLVHPATVWGVDATKGSAYSNDTRVLSNALCEVHLEPQKWDDCVPWGNRACWHRIIDVGQSTTDPDRNAPRHIIDEIGYLRLVYADRFQIKVGKFWPASEGSAYAALLDPCDSSALFERHVVVLDDILSSVKPHAQLAPDRRGDGTAVNGVTALGRVLEDRVDGADASYVERLQGLKTARNSFSHERRKELIAALRSLGVDQYPPRSWDMAWIQVTSSVAEALSGIRTALQVSGGSAGV